jgi:hypothetical protein
LILKIKFFTKGRAKQEKNISSTHTSTPLAPPKVFQFKWNQENFSEKVI